MKLPTRDDGAAECLAQAHDVGCHVPVLHAPQPAGAAHAGLHLVGDEQDAPLVADLADLGEVVGRRDDGAGLALHRLHDHGGDVDAHLRRRCPSSLSSGVGVAVGARSGRRTERVERLAELALAPDARGAERLAVEAPGVEMMPRVWFGFLRRAHSLASFMAPSLASVPELQKKEYRRSPGVTVASR